MSVPYADILILALVAGFILLRLRSILGEDSGFDGRGDQQDGAGPLSRPKTDKVLPLRPGDMPPLDLDKAKASKDKDLVKELPNFLQEKIEDIKKIEPGFDLSEFIGGAKGAFEMVLKAFNENDHETLKYLLADDIEDMFVEEAEKMANAETKSETTLVSIAEATVEDVELKKKHASITLKIVSEQIYVERDDDDNIISGDASQVERVEDEWTFERDLGANSPNWIVSAT